MKRILICIISLFLAAGCNPSGKMETTETAIPVSSSSASSSEVVDGGLLFPTNMSTPEATPGVEQLLENLKSDNPEIRFDAAWYLYGNPDPQVVEPLIIAMKDENPEVRRQAIIALEGIDDPRILEPMIEALNDEVQEVRFEASIGVSTHTDTETARSYISQMSDEDFYFIFCVMDWFFVRALPGTEAVLIELLNRFGNENNFDKYIKLGPISRPKEIAEILLNSGNSMLETAAAEWASKNGYQMVPADNPSNYLQWGK